MLVFLYVAPDDRLTGRGRNEKREREREGTRILLLHGNKNRARIIIRLCRDDCSVATFTRLVRRSERKLGGADGSIAGRLSACATTRLPFCTTWWKRRGLSPAIPPPMTSSSSLPSFSMLSPRRHQSPKTVHSHYARNQIYTTSPPPRRSGVGVQLTLKTFHY